MGELFENSILYTAVLVLVHFFDSLLKGLKKLKVAELSLDRGRA
jgi:hypothetical protein